MSDKHKEIVEEILDPDLPICDPHHHLWAYPSSRYLLDEILADTNAGHNITHTVFVECTSMFRDGVPAAMAPIGETEFVCGIAAMSASGGYGPCRIADGIVSFADLTLGDAVKPVLEAHIAAGGERYKGIRHASGWDADPKVRNSHSNPPQDLLQAKDFRTGFAHLVAMGLSFDAWLFHPQIEELADLAQAFPNATIILDHVGGPLGIGPYAGKRKEVFDKWRTSIEVLAECPNVVVKLGGLLMKINGFGFDKQTEPASSATLATAVAPYIEHCIDKFGVDRCMFESNFPVDRVSCSYAVLWNVFKRIATGFSKAEKATLFRDTAMRVYRLPSA